jgi:hypothetical protein
MNSIYDMLFLYRRSKVITASGITGTICSISDHLVSVQVGESTISKPITEVRLILRPIDAMTEGECRAAYFIYFGTTTASDFSQDSGSAYFRPKQIPPTPIHIQRIIDGEDYSDGDFTKVYKLLDYLHDKSIDYRNLKSENIAVY